MMKNKLLIAHFITALLFIFSYKEARAQISTDLNVLPPEHAVPAHPTALHHKTKKTQREKQEPKQHSTSSNKTHANHTNINTSPSHTSSIAIPTIPTAAPSLPVLAPPFPIAAEHPHVPAEIILPVKNAFNQIISLNSPSSSPESPPNLRIIFARNSADFKEETLHKINDFAKILAKSPEKRLILKSYATIIEDDTALPRRIALSRALSIRSLLMQAGIASTRIYPMVFGEDPHLTDPKAPHEYVDILIEENPKITNIPFKLPANSAQHASLTK